MNRLGSNDSNIALADFVHCRENDRMERLGEKAIDKLQILVLERRDPSSNMAHFYVLAMEPTLFGDVAVVREWDGSVAGGGDGLISMPTDEARRKRSKFGWIGRRVAATGSARRGSSKQM
jgi:predicted DNA-binding WGR domain protein